MTMTLSRHLLEGTHVEDPLPESLGVLFSQLAFAAKKCAREIGQAALKGQLGLAGAENSTGDSQKKLDIYCHEVFEKALVDTQLVWALASEEVEETVCVDCHLSSPQYLLAIDPIDGSSNIDTNGYLGTIFGIFANREGDSVDTVFTGLKGREMIAAGYVLYGASTTFVYSAGKGVHGFTLDKELGDFMLSHENIRSPERGKVFCTNLARKAIYSPKVQNFLDQLTEDGYSLRYSGALVADFHRVLLEGGIFFYPADENQSQGKLRLVYEGAPLAYLAEQAGAQGSDGERPLLDIPFENVHQRCPVFLGTGREISMLLDTKGDSK